MEVRVDEICDKLKKLDGEQLEYVFDFIQDVLNFDEFPYSLLIFVDNIDSDDSVDYILYMFRRHIERHKECKIKEVSAIVSFLSNEVEKLKESGDVSVFYTRINDFKKNNFGGIGRFCGISYWEM